MVLFLQKSAVKMVFYTQHLLARYL